MAPAKWDTPEKWGENCCDSMMNIDCCVKQFGRAVEHSHWKNVTQSWSGQVDVIKILLATWVADMADL